VSEKALALEVLAREADSPRVCYDCAFAEHLTGDDRWAGACRCHLLGEEGVRRRRGDTPGGSGYVWTFQPECQPEDWRDKALAELAALRGLAALDPQERSFLAELTPDAAGVVPQDVASVYLDWLADAGRDAARVRSLVVRPGDVVVFTAAPETPDIEAALLGLTETFPGNRVIVLPHGARVAALPVAEVRRLLAASPEGPP
jgi:hypothetical protein